MPMRKLHKEAGRGEGRRRKGPEGDEPSQAANQRLYPAPAAVGVLKPES